jgi:hypothetical protein
MYFVVAVAGMYATALLRVLEIPGSNLSPVFYVSSNFF